mmetsp:Transcript_9705/g.17056  ORF Transcript_9705/g.17056 Transcript_9705/m.17056 type:complete len:126 (+) Transcript_9705:46-423(+)
MGNYQLCTKRPQKQHVPVGSYVWKDGFQIHDEPSDRDWFKCKEMIKEELPAAEDFVRQEMSPTQEKINVKLAAAKLVEHWILGINERIMQTGYILDACGWTQYVSNGQGGHVTENKLALNIILLR